jgi:K+-transporting ATPase A subunit
MTTQAVTALVLFLLVLALLAYPLSIYMTRLAEGSPLGAPRAH